LKVAAGEEWVPVYRLMNAEPDQSAADPFKSLFWTRVGNMRQWQQQVVAKKQVKATSNRNVKSKQ
jgi:hypothetical protein